MAGLTLFLLSRTPLGNLNWYNTVTHRISPGGLSVMSCPVVTDVYAAFDGEGLLACVEVEVQTWDLSPGLRPICH